MVGLTVIPDFALQRAHDQQLRDIVRYFDSDIVFTPQTVHEHFLESALGGATTIATQPLQSKRPVEMTRTDNLRLVWVSTPEAVDRIAREEAESGGNSPETYLMSDQLSVSIDLVQLEARLEGLSAYREPLVEHDTLDRFTHLSIEANPEYRAVWEGADIQGIMPGANEQQGTPQASIAHFELQPDGIVGGRTRALGKFGLQSVTQVAESRAQTLREAGIQSREELAKSSVRVVSNLSGIGDSLARKIIESAQVIEEAEVRKDPAAELPDQDPIFIDIETDGLNPTMVWLIGVLDQGNKERYMSFIETDPDQPRPALEAFLSWLEKSGNGRPIVAYNGWGFDFPVIREHVGEHCPEHLETWNSARKFDLYDWAVKKSNAILPGLTNKLEDVAPALGWEPTDTGLTGAEVGRLFQSYASNPCPATELDWTRHKAYCEDDVRGLAYVYNVIKDTDNRMTKGRRSKPSSSNNSAQGTLGDFGA